MRIDGVPRNQAGPLVRLVYRLTRRELGRVVDPVTVYAHRPSILLGYGLFEKGTARADAVDEKLKLLAELRAGQLVECEFCIDIGAAIARDAGIPERQLLELHRYAESEHFTVLEKLVLDYATAISRTPIEVSDELFARLREHFDEPQLVELTNVIALENMRARFNGAFAIGPNGFSEGKVCALPATAAAATDGAAAPAVASG